MGWKRKKALVYFFHILVFFAHFIFHKNYAHSLYAFSKYMCIEFDVDFIYQVQNNTKKWMADISLNGVVVMYALIYLSAFSYGIPKSITD